MPRTQTATNSAEELQHLQLAQARRTEQQYRKAARIKIISGLIMMILVVTVALFIAAAIVSSH